MSTVRSGIFGEELATNYDESRGLVEDAVREVTEILAAELTGRGPVLEIGVGTGRVALPLAQAGIPMVGLDPSAAMLGRLVAKSGGHPPFGLLRGDGGRLPFADGALGASLLCHVLHLIPDWEGALREALRVLRPDGALLLEGRGGREQRRGVHGRLRRHFHETLGFTPPPPIGVRDESLVEATLERLGWRGRALTPVVATERIGLGALIDRTERGISSSEQAIPVAERSRGWEETRRWAEAEIGPLDEEVEVRRELVWHVYERVAA